MCRLLRFLLLAVLIGSLAAPAWASDSYIQVPPDSTGKKLDTDQLTVGSNTVQRQRIQIGGTGATDVLPISSNSGARVNLRDNAGTELGTSGNPVRTDPTGTTTQPVSGSITVTQGTGSNLHIQCDSGCAAQGDTTGNTNSINAANDVSVVALSGQRGAMIYLAAGTLSAVLIPEICTAGASCPLTDVASNLFVPAYFVDPTTGLITSTLTVTNPNADTSLGIVWTGAATHVRVRVTSFTSGTADMTVRAVQNVQFSPIYGNDGTALTAITTLTAGSKTPMTVAVVDSGGNQISSFGGTGGTGQSDKSGFTTGTTSGTVLMGLFNDSWSSPADDTIEDAVAAVLITPKRALHVALYDSSGNEITPMPSTGGTVTVTQGTGTNLHTVCDSGCAGGAQFNADDPAGTTDLGTAALGVRQDGNGTTSSLTGDYEQLHLIDGKLKVAVMDASGNRLPAMDAAARRAYVQITDGTNSVALDADGGLNAHITNGTATLANDASTFTAGQPNVAVTDSAMFGYNGSAYARVGVTNTDQLKVNCSNCTGSGVNQTDKTTFTTGSSSFVSGGGFYQTDPTTNSLTANQMGAFQATTYRAQHVNLRNSSATEIGTATTPIRTDPTGTTAQPVTQNTSPWIVTDNAGCAGATLTNTLYQNISTTTSAVVLTGTGGTNIYICQLNLVVSAADNVAFVTGTGTTCGTGTAGVFGGTSAATGWNFAANGGISMGNGKHVLQRGATGADLCILVSGSAQVSGSIVLVKF